MSGVVVVFREQIRDGLVSSLTTIAESSRDSAVVDGAARMAKSQALSFGITWPGIVADVTSNLPGELGKWFELIVSGQVVTGRG